MVWIPIIFLFFVMGWYLHRIYNPANVIEVEEQIVEDSEKELEFGNPEQMKSEFVREFNGLKGRRIESVYYISYKDDVKEYDNDQYHRLTNGVIFKLEMGHWLNWIWKDGEFDEVNGFGPERYRIEFKSIDKVVDEGLYFVDMSTTTIWKRFINSRVENILLWGIDLEHIRCWTDLVVETEIGNLNILSFNELNELKISIGISDSLIVFDDDYLRKVERGKYLKSY